MTEPLDLWIARKEGLRLRPYHDKHGFMTIGYGHNLQANGITIAIADQLLSNDIAEAKKLVDRNLAWTANVDPARRDAFYHLCFWIGIGKLLGFVKMMAAAKAGDWKLAANEVLNSALHDDIPERAEEIANRLLKGDAT
jgi:lysozyme